MKINKKNEFTPAAAAAAFTPELFDSDRCRSFELKLTRGENPTCPFCGHKFDENEANQVFEWKPVKCKNCGRQSAPRTGTLLSGSTLSSQEFAFIVHCLEWEIPVSHIAKSSGLSLTSVYSWRDRLFPAGK